MSRLNLRVFLSVLLMQTAAYAQSQTDCHEDPPSQSEKLYNKKLKVQAEDMGLKLRLFLGENARSVAIVSRAGADLSQREMQNPARHKYSHTGIVVKEPTTGKWKFVHVLNDCAGPSSSIHTQGLAEFFMDDPFYLDVSIIVPSVELQDKILRVITDKSVGGRGWASALHNGRYSNIANPFSTKYQNSNMWVLAVLAAAKTGARNQAEAQSSYRASGYQPSQVRLSGLESGFGELFVENAKTDDHASDEHGSGWFNFASSASVHAYAKKVDKIQSEKVLCHASGCDLRVRGGLLPAPVEE